MNIRELLYTHSIIAAAEHDQLALAVRSKVCAVLLMHGKVTNLLEPQFQELSKLKPVFVHTDLVRGLSNDKEAVALLAEHVRPAGIVSTKSAMIRAAKKEGLLTVQRVFLIDTGSFHTAIRSIKENEPDAIEIMPGIAPSIIPAFREETGLPIIAAGLISTHEQVKEALKAGADAVSLSRAELWNL
ncbi:glycerol-3-phosphate responsive antiterminator [Paenibacillus enshidis]|uniref:Glycerol uptake operon antiterminator regulatory protein n=1 Tax=Paenibacillus enshidis TaxID=1458439 RepID=A0ABV5AX19_9BACL